MRIKGGLRILGGLMLGGLGGCISASVSSSGGGASKDASSCIVLNVNDAAGMQTDITNNCDFEVNILEFSTGSLGVFVVPADSMIRRSETIGAYGACMVPFEPRGTGDFEFFCTDDV